MKTPVPGDMVTVNDQLVLSARLSGWSVISGDGPTEAELVNVFRDPGDYALLLAVVFLDDRSARYALARSAHGQAWLPIEELALDGRFR